MDYSKIRRIKRIIFKDRIINEPSFLSSVLEDMINDLQKGLYYSPTDIAHISLDVDPFLYGRREAIYDQLYILCKSYFGVATTLTNIYVKEEFLDPRMDNDHCILDMTMKVKSPKPVTFGLTPNDSLLPTAFERIRKTKIKKVIFNPPATVVYWSDGSKTVSKVQDGDTWDSEKGLAMAIIKKTIGLKEFNKHIDEHAVNADFWHYATSEVLAKKSVDELGFKPHMDAIVSRYGTDLVKKYLKDVEENGMDIKGE